MDAAASAQVSYNQGLQQFQEQQMQVAAELKPTQLVPPVAGDGDRVSLNARFSTYSAFAKSYPKMHKAILTSLAQSVLSDMRRHEANMKKLARESRQHG